MSIAKITLLGNIGRDPETRYTPKGRMNVSFSMAVSRRWYDAGGNQQEKTNWFRVTCWGKLAETMDKLTQEGALAKGRQVLVIGPFDTNEWTTQQGEKRTSLEVTADTIQLTGAARTNESSDAGNYDDGRGNIDYDSVPF